MCSHPIRDLDGKGGAYGIVECHFYFRYHADGDTDLHR